MTMENVEEKRIKTCHARTHTHIHTPRTHTHTFTHTLTHHNTHIHTPRLPPPHHHHKYTPSLSHTPQHSYTHPTHTPSHTHTHTHTNPHILLESHSTASPFQHKKSLVNSSLTTQHIPFTVRNNKKQQKDITAMCIIIFTLTDCRQA